MNIRKRPLAVCIAIPLVTGGLSSWLTHRDMAAIEALRQPPLAPPGWLFPVVWSALYTMMGVASYLIYTSDAPEETKKRALTAYGVQLAFNFLWTIFFFHFRWFLFALVWLAALWGLILYTAVLFGRIRKSAGLLLVPYLLWVTFALYLNFGIHLLNAR